LSEKYHRGENMSIVEQLTQELQDKFPAIDQKSVETALSYLKYYNYINGSELTEAVVKAATSDFQDRFGIEVDGAIGPQTIKAMAAPRCGCRDVEHLVENASQPNKWGLKHLKLYIEDYIPGLTKDEMESIIQDVFNKTSKIIDVTFEITKKSSEAQFIVRVSSDPRDELGSPSGVLAFQYLPPKFNYTGPALEGVFDGAEKWVGDRGGNGIRFRNVFTHEVIGHGLGLQHSKIKTALLAPFYDPDVAFLVSPDDVERLIELYGKAKDQPTTPTTPTEPPPGEESVVLTIRGKDLKINIPGFRIVKL
jgi:matrix metalloproteinase-14 (membrane-inserted)